jgi:hypothetical protein
VATCSALVGVTVTCTIRGSGVLVTTITTIVGGMLLQADSSTARAISKPVVTLRIRFSVYWSSQSSNPSAPL